MRERLDCTLSPGAMLRAVSAERMPFLLVGRWAGVRAIVGCGPSRVVRGEFPPDVADVASSCLVGGGWFGYLGFWMGHRVERLPPAPPRPVVLPDAVFGWYENVLVLDDEGRWWFESLRSDASSDDVRPLLEDPGARPWSLSAMTLHGGGADVHRAAVAECVERIAAGELFQANLCVRLDGAFSGDAASAFVAASERLSPAYGAYFGLDSGAAVLSFSPELFLRRAGRSAETGPIKGTAPRLRGDVAARDALVESAKDAAEHVMIVDLMRNDLGRVAAYGTVTAADRPDVEAHPGVWHLVSRVRATLREDVGDGDLLRATFPPGSVTGAPKVQALKVISELEGTQREVYTGAVGYLSPVAGLELNVAIRTLEVRGSQAWLGCGGGIVADSDPEAELREALDKARPIIEALGSSVPAVAPSRPFEVPALPRLDRPDPAQGVFTTLAIRDGRPVDLDRHLARLAASAAELYGGGRPDRRYPAARSATPSGAQLAEAVRHLAADAGDRRLRIVVTPAGEIDTSLTPIPPGPPADVRLSPVVLVGGLGDHKWLDRSPLEAHPDALILDLDGTVLESATANVWAIEGATLITPPADGRILPGITRDRLLERATIEGLTLREEEFGIDRLRQADGIVLTSSIRIAAPASLDDTAPTERARAVAATLRTAATATPTATLATAGR